MEYSINKLTKMSGLSTRTLRYYDEIGLLKPARVATSGYRIYGEEQVDALQQILFYRELGFSLVEIQTLVNDPDFDREKAFAEHLLALERKREQLDALIRNITKSLAAIKGGITMTSQEKFEGFKQKLIDDNETQYGEEARARYGDSAVSASNAHLQGLTQEQYDESQRLGTEIEEALGAAFAAGDPASELAQKACDLHRQWLCIFYPRYSSEYHKGLAEMYVADERFRAYYDKIAPGCAEFLRAAINIYCK